MNEVDILIEEAKREEKYFQNYLKYAKILKRKAQELLGKVQVYIFGSILRKDEIAQDIDLLIISPKLKTTEKKSKILAKLRQKTGISSPFQIHLITPEEYKDWYKFFIKEKVKI